MNFRPQQTESVLCSALFSTDHGAVSHAEGEEHLTFDESEAFAQLKAADCKDGVAK